MNRIFFLLLLLPSARALAACVEVACRLDGKAGVTCERDDTGGSICIVPAHTSGFDYPQKMAVIIPPGVNEPHRLILFMHGNRGTCPLNGESALDTAKRWHLNQQLQDTGAKKSVIIMPMSTGPTTTYDTSLAPRFNQFKTWAEGFIGAKAGSQWTIAGHSGAGRAIAKIMSRGDSHVDTALMLDAAYNVDKNRSNWNQVKGGPAQIFNVYTDGAGTKSNSSTLKGLLGGQLHSSHALALEHCNVPRQDFGPLLKKAFLDRRAHLYPQLNSPPAHDETESGT